MLIVNQKEREAVNMAVDALNMYFRQYESEEDLPELDEDGYSKKLLISFENMSDPDIGEYRQDKDGSGDFYIGDFDDTFLSHNLIVNGWMPLPKCIRK